MSTSEMNTSETNRSENKLHLQVLDGGRSLPLSDMDRILLDAYVTDTRLMGVLAIGVHWFVASPSADRDDPDSWEDMYQYFYIDCEEAGLETCHVVRGDANSDVATEAERIENAMVCGLGANRIDIDEHQLLLLLQHWARFNKAHDLPMPANAEHYAFLLEPQIEENEENEEDWALLMTNICPLILKDEPLIHYFLMRCFGRDHEGALYLMENAIIPEAASIFAPYDHYVRATFCRNRIEPCRRHADGFVTYRCESLIEMEGSYEVVLSLVTTHQLRIRDCVLQNRMPISSAEAALILKKPEYIIPYDILLSDEDLEDNIDEFTLGFQTTMSSYPNGRLFMSYRASNDHVKHRVFLLSNDVQGMFFLSNGGQLLVCAHNTKDLQTMQEMLARSVLRPYLLPRRVYRAQDPLLYEFMRSDCERFEDFVLEK